MPDIIKLNSKWTMKCQAQRGIRFEAGDCDLLNAIGFGEFLAREAAKHQRETCLARLNSSTPAAAIGLTGTEDEMEDYGRHSSRSSGTTKQQDATEANRRAQRILRQPKMR